MSMNFGCTSVVFVPHVVVGYDTHVYYVLTMVKPVRHLQLIGYTIIRRCRPLSGHARLGRTRLAANPNPTRGQSRSKENLCMHS